MDGRPSGVLRMKIISQCREPDECTMVLFSKPKRKFRMKQTKMLRSLFVLFTLFLVCCAASLFVQTSFAQTTPQPQRSTRADRKSTRLNSSHLGISYAVF